VYSPVEGGHLRAALKTRKPDVIDFDPRINVLRFAAKVSRKIGANPVVASGNTSCRICIGLAHLADRDRRGGDTAGTFFRSASALHIASGDRTTFRST